MLANNLMEVSAEQGVGGLNLQPARDLGPRVPFVRKISELNRESPLMKSTSPSIAPNADRVHDVAKLNRFESLRSVLTRPTGGGRGFKSLAPWGAATAQGLTRRFFTARTFEKISGNQTIKQRRPPRGRGAQISGALGAGTARPGTRAFPRNSFFARMQRAFGLEPHSKNRREIQGGGGSGRLGEEMR